MARRQRLDAELVRRQLAVNLAEARALVAEHKVQVNGAFADKEARLVSPGDSIELAPDRPPFVSRGGLKLAAALDRFDVDPQGLRCLDAGASTGGFTDCLLQRGAAQVVAVDVGYGQLHESLVGHPQVVNLERTNIRRLTTDDIGGPVQLLVGDLSFISLTTILASLAGLCESGAAMVMLVKPQFEAQRREVSRGGGVVVDPEIWRRVLGEVTQAADEVGSGAQAAMVSPIRGADGNVEFLYHFVVGAPPSAVDVASLVTSVDKTAPPER